MKIKLTLKETIAIRKAISGRIAELEKTLNDFKAKGWDEDFVESELSSAKSALFVIKRYINNPFFRNY